MINFLKTSHNSIKKAFTLVELLVVISIIALLLSIMMPALSKARESAKSVMCKTHLRTIGQAEILYASSNNDQMAYTRGDRAGNYGFFWAAQLWAVFNGTTIPLSSDTKRERIERPTWLFCPSESKPVKNQNVWSDVWINDPRAGKNGDFWLKNICYTRNSYGQGWYQDGGTQTLPGKYSRLKQVSTLVNASDGVYISMPSPYCVDKTGRSSTDRLLSNGLINPSWYVTQPGDGRVTEYRHAGKRGLNVLLWDGHVDTAKDSILDKFEINFIRSSR